MRFGVERALELVHEWKNRIGLRDWDVKVDIVRYFELIDEEALATVTYKVSKKQAVIKLRDPNDIEPNKHFPINMEMSIIHELLHLHFAPLGITADNLHEEHAVNALTLALFDLKYQEP
jgi:hypothetical protein